MTYEVSRYRPNGLLILEREQRNATCVDYYSTNLTGEHTWYRRYMESLNAPEVGAAWRAL